MKIFCPDCGTQAVLEPETWRCQCGGAWETVLPETFDPALIDTTETSVWRYKRLYGLDFDQPKIVMGAGWTPLLPLTLDDRPVFVKPEYFAPTASFKDRGTELMINILAHQGVTHIAEDSSGNAGASVAAFSARAGMKAEIFVPAHASPAKQAQIAVYGASVNPDPRSAGECQTRCNRHGGKGCHLRFARFPPRFPAGSAIGRLRIMGTVGASRS